jgi:HSP20 family protein
MPSIRYINQTAPFWDFVRSMEQQGAEHPLFGGQRGSDSEEDAQQSFNPWAFHPFAHRPHPNHQHPQGPPPPPHGEEVPPPPFTEKDGSPDTVQNEKGEPSGKAPQHEGRRGRCGGGPPGGFGRRGHCGPKRGGPHGFGRGGPWGRGGFPFGGFGGFWNENKEEESDSTFKPEADVFDTESAYVVHLSVPGAKKEDIAVTWDAEKSEVAVSGIVHRPGDEEFLKTLAMDERKVGVFERKVRLGSLANPAQVDVDGINAKLEDGILRVEIPKLDKDYVEVKMVDIE